MPGLVPGIHVFTVSTQQRRGWPRTSPAVTKEFGEAPVPLSLAAAREVLARANRMIANEGVLDAFGHVTMRHPSDPGRYLMARSRGPELVRPEDIHEFTLDSQIVTPIKERLYSERVIHGEIYKARPEVNAVCHHHAPSILPFCISGVTLEPVYHLGATIGAQAPFWDARNEFGSTSLIVASREEGASLARALGANWIVLMRRHGATVAGRTLEELTFRTIYIARNAALQIQAHGLGHVSPLNAEETELAGHYNLQPGPIARAWEYWSVRLDKAEGHWRPANRGAKRARRARKIAKAKRKR
jgi:ribulose-5-phosphate 4-epimerase/fuculose-1-phosphate aldolase